MRIRMLLAWVIAFAAIIMTIADIDQERASRTAAAASQNGNVWNSTMLWYPTLSEAGDAIAGLLNQIDATCSLDVDPVQATNGAGPEGTVYAFSVNWACPSEGLSGSVWQSSMFWYPTLGEAGDALAAQMNMIDAACATDIDSVQATNGVGPEGTVYAFLVTWACV